MFTGIVTEVGRVRSVVDTPRDRRFVVEGPGSTGGLAIGASVAHSGVCLTVVEIGEDTWTVEVSNETLAATTVDAWRPGTPVNLERAARLGDELGGHVVSGHVDGVGEVVSVTPEAGSHRVVVRAPDPLHRFIAPKGSITLDGVSLTVNAVDGRSFGVNLISHTWGATTLRDLRPGTRVNLEVDGLARYAARWLETAA